MNNVNPDPFHPDLLRLEPTAPAKEPSQPKPQNPYFNRANATTTRHVLNSKTKKVAAVVSDNSGLSGVDRSGDRPGFEYLKLPRWVLDRLVGKNIPWTVLPVFMALYETWYRKSDHTSLVHPRVRLTNAMLKKYGVSRKQKYPALDILVAKKLVSQIERSNGRNPEVWLVWGVCGK